MDVKLNKIIDYLMFLFLLSMGFLRIGFSVYPYTFSIPDLILLFIFIFYVLKRFNKFQVMGIAKRFTGAYLLFFVSICISLIDAKNLKAGYLELLAYWYGFIVICMGSLYIYEYRERALKVLLYSSIISIVLVFLPTILFYTPYKIKYFFTFNNWNYLFFLNMPNQLPIYLIICFSIYLMCRNYLDDLKIWRTIISILLPFLFIIPIFISGSRTGSLLGFGLLLFAYFLEILNMRSAKKAIVYILIFLILMGLSFYLIKNSSHPKALFRRSLLVIKNIKAVSLTKGDVRTENFSDAFKAFKKHPVNGVGLGNIWKNYSKWEIHNSFLSILSETGLIGFIPFLFLLLYIFYCIFKYNRKFEYFVIYFVILFYSIQHHIIRQRWFWFFLIVFLHILMLNNKNNDSMKNRRKSLE